MNKNWNDRADKDLFFTILSVKNIGVISGSEWVTIGNHMRSLGYGFTNEGCRYVDGVARCRWLACAVLLRCVVLRCVVCCAAALVVCQSQQTDVASKPAIILCAPPTSS